MQGLSPPLLVAVAVFLAAVLWRIRPAFGFGQRPGASRAAFKDDHEKALALCDAADLLAARGAKGLYLRAMRLDPGSVQVVQRAVTGLAKRPRALEQVLWRHLAAREWTGSREATGEALDALRVLYEGPLKNAMRAKVFGHARDAVKG
jgi:hypothetical protein